MERTEAVIRSILGSTRRNISPLTCAVKLTVQMLFIHHVAMDEILVTKDIYPEVAKLLRKSVGAVTRRVERLANYCWDWGDRDRLDQIIGRRLRCCPTPKDMLVYLAFYSYLELPFFTAIEERPSLLF